MAKYKKIILVLLLGLFTFNPINVFAQEGIEPPKEETLEAKVINILEEKGVELEGKKQLYQRIELVVTKGVDEGENINVENGSLLSSEVKKFKVGDKVLVTKTQGADNQTFYFISDYIRRDGLLGLSLIFLGLIGLIGGKRGVLALVGMVISFLVIFYFVLPQILAGHNPALISIIASIFIIPVTFYLSHGLNKKTTAAILGTIVSLVVTVLLAKYFVELTRLSGFASEEAGYLQAFTQGTVNIRGLILAGIIVGVLGVLDDITVSQAAVVDQLKKTSQKLSSWELYSKAMDVGRDHIASSINTLVLVYAGVALPLLLIFLDNPHPFSEIINYEIIAEEIVRTLVASIGLILAVPITTLISSVYLSRE